MHTYCKNRDCIFLFVCERERRRNREYKVLWFWYLFTLIKFPRVEPPLWIRNVTIARFITFHLFDIRQDTFLFFFWLPEETCLLFFHELIFSKLPLLLTCVSRPEMYWDSNLGTVQSQRKVYVVYCAILFVLTLAVCVGGARVVHAVLFTEGSIGVMRSCFTGQPSHSI